MCCAHRWRPGRVSVVLLTGVCDPMYRVYAPAPPRPFQAWQNKNPSVNDVGSTYVNVKISTQAAQIIAAARELLDL